ncbi:MAG TPA: hypothetical protein VIG62_06870 [Blastocatellia bacterium]|jgi:hypothetical protein
MKPVALALIATLSLCGMAEAQKRKPSKSTTRPRTATRPAETKPAARIIGSPVVIVTKTGDKINGALLDITAYSVRIRTGNLESVHALDTIESLTFGNTPAASPKPTIVQVSPEFLNEAKPALNSFQSTARELSGGVDYTEYGRLITELRRGADRFISKYSATDNPAEARAVALLAGALNDYTWARTIWTLKFGRSGDGMVEATESPSIADTVTIYADVRAAAASGDKFSTDKLVSGLWRKAENKIGQVATALSQSR